MPFANTARAFVTAAALTAPPGAQAQPPPTPAPQTPSPTPQADARPWLPVKSTPQAAPPAPPQYPQPPAAPAPPPARDVPPPIPPPPPAAGLGQADETTSTTTTTTTRKSGGLIITNNASGSTNQIAIGNYGAGWGSPAPASFARPARDFATPPDDGAGGGAVTGTRYRDRDVPLAQAQRIDLERPGVFRRFGYYLCPKERYLATPRAAVPTGLSVAVQPVAVAVPVPAAPVVPVASPQYAPAPVYAAPAAPRKSCLPWLLGR